MTNLPPVILAFVLIAIAFRKYLPMQPRIWMLMLIGALTVIATEQINLTQAWNAIDFNIIGFLLGAFIIGEALDQSGLIDRISRAIFKHGKAKAVFLLILIIVVGIPSAFLMNDTIAIIATPLLIRISSTNQCSAKPFLLATAFAITIDSVMSPIGNPQNLLIAIQGGLPQPFITFFYYLAVPTFINLIICWLFLLMRYRAVLFDHSTITVKVSNKEPVRKNSTLCYISLIIFIILIIVKVLLLNHKTFFNLPLSLLSLLAAAPIIVGNQQRLSIIKNIDWGTLIFFVAMFVLMKSVWNSGLLQTLLNHFQHDISHPATILGASIIISQLISNVPFVALYLPLLMHIKASTLSLMMLAAGSTIAGNFLPLGAASNMIILQQADKHRDPGFGVLDFIIVGVPLGCVNALIFYWWLH